VLGVSIAQVVVLTSLATLKSTCNALSSHDETAGRARGLLEKAIELTEADDAEAALEASGSATELYRSLAAADPGRHLPDLLQVLQNRAWIYVSAPNRRISRHQRERNSSLPLARREPTGRVSH
jgi:hypothetical protein